MIDWNDWLNNWRIEFKILSREFTPSPQALTLTLSDSSLFYFLRESTISCIVWNSAFFLSRHFLADLRFWRSLNKNIDCYDRFYWHSLDVEIRFWSKQTNGPKSKKWMCCCRRHLILWLNLISWFYQPKSNSKSKLTCVLGATPSCHSHLQARNHRRRSSLICSWLQTPHSLRISSISHSYLLESRCSVPTSPDLSLNWPFYFALKAWLLNLGWAHWLFVCQGWNQWTGCWMRGVWKYSGWWFDPRRQCRGLFGKSWIQLYFCLLFLTWLDCDWLWWINSLFLVALRFKRRLMIKWWCCEC